MGVVKYRYFSFWLIFLAIFLGVLQPLFVGATPDKETFWSWTDSEPEIVYSKLIKEINYDNCPTILRTIKVSGEAGEYQSCVYEGEKTSFAIYWPSSLNFAVKLPNDSKMHKLHTECSMYNVCIYLPGTDTLVMKQNISNGGIGLLLIYKNFTERLIPKNVGPIKEYDFDSSNPDYTSHFPDGDYWLINGFSASNNGEWLAAEVLNRGFVLINIKTLQTKQIDNNYFRYWVGFNPLPEIAVSDDGRHIAAMGVNVGFRILDIDDRCGANMSYHNVPKTPIQNPCKEAPIDINKAIDWFRVGHKPSFSSDGGELSFYAESYLVEKREILLRASQYESKTLQYLALGDSFTSGEGELEDKYYAPRTNDKFEKCHLSLRSYPFLVSKIKNFDPSLSKSVACSGATTHDINSSNIKYYGQNNRLGSGENKMNLSDSEVILAVNQAEQEFIPGRVKQIRFVEKYRPQYITIGIGGNDAGLMDKLATCASPGTCRWVSDEEKRAQTAIEIANLFDKLVKTFQDIHSKSKNSKIYAVGYPKIINPSGNCSAAIEGMFTKEERLFMNESISYLKQVISNASKRAGIGFIDIEDSLNNQALCGSKKPLAMNGVEFGDDNKVAWIVNIGNETFHPNHIGHQLIADNLKDKINNKYCENRETLCPDENIKTPTISAYWMFENDKQYSVLRRSQFLEQTDEPNKLAVKVEPYSFEPNSKIKVEIQSEPTNLGTFITNEDGSLSTDIHLPEDLEYGYHTVSILGTSYSGDSIELYQSVKHANVETSELIGEINEQQTKNISYSTPKASQNKISGRQVVKNNTTDYINDPQQSVLGDETDNLSQDNVPKLKNTSATIGVVFLIILISIILLFKKIWKTRPKNPDGPS
ncbi:MAG: SGNH/GDSL hydrolase family protein [Candidatus Saccharimonadales bacterium]